MKTKDKIQAWEIFVSGIIVCIVGGTMMYLAYIGKLII